MAKRSAPTDKKRKPLKATADISKVTASKRQDLSAENSDLREENQRLRRAIEERDSELGIINSVQESLASKVDMQSIYDLVGEKIQEVFDVQGVDLTYLDESNQSINYYYSYEKGRSLGLTQIPFTDRTRYLIETKQPIVINENLVEATVKLTGSPPIVQAGELPKSLIMMPLIVSDRVKGYIAIYNVDRENVFSESDVRLLTTISNSMSMALESARLFDETQRLLKETEQRNAELAIINSVQSALAAKLDMQGIYDAVGEKIREIFKADTTFISFHDQVNNAIVAPYYIEKGVRPDFTSRPYGQGLNEVMLESGKPLLLNTAKEAAQAGAFDIASPDADKDLNESFLGVPLFRNGKAIGTTSVQSYKKYAFDENDMRLLTTLTNSMSVALESARLFDETQRLLKETEQRNAELAIINSVQSALAAKLDMQGIYDAVGDKIRSLFDAQSILIMAFDPIARTRQVKYYGEYGHRLTNSPRPLPYNKLAEHLVETKETLVFNYDLDTRITEFGMTVIDGAAQPKSAVFVPQIAGEEVIGLISLQNVEKEYAFTESDINLLSTFAASMSVAIENAQLYEEQLHLAEELKLVNKIRSQFLSSMSHELRTPLNAIINFVEIMGEGMVGPINSEQAELLSHSLKSARHLLQLINDVLDISKIQAGKLTLLLEDQVHLQEEIDAALNMVEGLARGNNLQLLKEIDADLPPVTCDRRRIRQVLLNLLSNAIKFTRTGSIQLVVKNLGSMIQFAIVDTGPGIPASELELIFDPFVQAENAAGVTQGTGLGLPISRSLARAHGGELWVESTPGAGSSFFFTLPLNGKGTDGQ